MEHLGPEIDIHGGGTDLRFPHHENEIAQSEAATGRTFVRSWFHVEHLLVDGQKMSKSLGNMYTVRDVLAKGYTGRELRYALLSGAHYSKNLNFTWQGMDDAKTALARVDEWRKRVRSIAESATSEDKIRGHEQGKQYARELIDNALSRDLNINAVLGHLFEWIRNSNGAMDRDNKVADRREFCHGSPSPIWMRLKLLIKFSVLESQICPFPPKSKPWPTSAPRRARRRISRRATHCASRSRLWVGR